MGSSDRPADAAIWIVLAVLLAPLVLQIGFALFPGAGSYAVTTGSMTPTIDRGSMIYTYDTGDYEAGDVVTFARESEIVTHRIVGERDDGFVTKGDANENADSWTIPANQIRGTVLFSIPLYGFLIRPTTVEGGALYVIGAGLALVIGGGRQLLEWT